MEEEIFKRTKVDFTKLISYGFLLDGNQYFYQQTILNQSFKVLISINLEGKIAGKIIEIRTNEEYSNFRIKEMNGQFVNKIRNEYQTILISIRDKCFIKEYFLSNQANRIVKVIFNMYHDKPIFPWNKYPGYGVFKKTSTGKWYGIIMNIDISKLTKGEKEVEILNVKLSPELIINLVKRKGFYQAYHMNKKYWLSIILDDTISDEEIVKYIKESYNLTK